MARPCSICNHDSREAIDKALIEGRSLSGIVAEYSGITKTSLFRHKESHLPALLTKAKEVVEVAQADNLLTQMRGLQARTLNILQNAEMTMEHAVALRAISEARRNLELLGKLAGELPAERVLIEFQPIIEIVIMILREEVRDREALKRVSNRLLLEANEGENKDV